MLSQIAYTMALGFPIVIWLGIFAFLFILAAASTGIPGLGVRMPLKAHRALAFMGIILALLHAIMAMSAYF